MTGPLITEDDLARHMRQTFPTDTERESAVLACQQAESAVLTYLRRPDLAEIPTYAHYAIRLVMLRQATSIFRTAGNERTSFSNGEVSMSINPRILTGDEKDLLRQYRRHRAITGEATPYTTPPALAMLDAGQDPDDLLPGNWNAAHLG